MARGPAQHSARNGEQPGFGRFPQPCGQYEKGDSENDHEAGQGEDLPAQFAPTFSIDGNAENRIGDIVGGKDLRYPLRPARKYDEKSGGDYEDI